MSNELYLDANGSTPVHPEVLDAFLAALRDAPGNAGASHPAGRRAHALVERARAEVAAALGAEPEEITFTSGGTESNNWALFGAAAELGKGHVLVSAIEHKSVLAPARALAERGFRVEILAPGPSGAVDLPALEARLRPDTVLVSVMVANNETGVVQPASEIGRLCRARGVRYHTDAVAALGKLRLDVRELGCDSLSLSAHKMYAPKGTGVLYAREGSALRPWVLGCGQQSGRRSGTENTAGAVAFGRAMDLWRRGALVDPRALASLREHLWQGLRERFPDVQRNGSGNVLANTLSVHVPGCDAVLLQSHLGARGISVGTGASAASGEPSHVLSAMGHSPERARSSLRFSLCADASTETVERCLAALDEILIALPIPEVRS
jgi:cysteine desulfurase